ncbi:MAG: CoA-transferase [Chloroflexota bacterium]
MTEWLSLSDAAALVEDGQTIALGGMTVYRRPVAFVRELLRRDPRPKDLTLLCFTAGFESDLLVGAGCVKTVRSVYFGLESFGFAPMFTEKANRGEIDISEETESSLAMGLRAQMAGVGFMPSTAWLGTDLPKLRPDVKTVIDPYTGEELMAFPAIPCDVAVLHGLEADADGNVKLNNNLGVDLDLALVAKTVIVTVERRVEQVERSTDGLLIPAPAATHIALAPRGAYPTSCYPDYPVSGGEFMRYVDACNAGKFEEYLAGFLMHA